MVGARGRPRSEQARRAILDTALRLCERDGYPQLTIKAIADEAGVGRQTVYRWWPDKASVLIEALVDLRRRKSPLLDPDTGDTLRDVRTVLEVTYELTQEITGRALIGLMADAQRDPELSERLQSSVLGPRRDALRAILRRGVEAGELAKNVPGTCGVGTPRRRLSLGPSCRAADCGGRWRPSWSSTSPSPASPRDSASHGTPPTTRSWPRASAC